MPASPEDVFLAQRDWITTAIRAAETHVRRLRRLDVWAIVLGTISSLLATFVAGLTAWKSQPVVANDWVTTCSVAAGLSLAAAVATGLHKALGVTSRLTRASACAGKLRALEIASSLGGRAGPELARECEQVAAEYPDVLTV